MIKSIKKDKEDIIHCSQSELTKEAMYILKFGQEVTPRLLIRKLHCDVDSGYAVFGMLYYYGCLYKYKDNKYYYCISNSYNRDKIIKILRDPLPTIYN